MMSPTEGYDARAAVPFELSRFMLRRRFEQRTSVVNVLKEALAAISVDVSLELSSQESKVHGPFWLRSHS